MDDCTPACTQESSCSLCLFQAGSCLRLFLALNFLNHLPDDMGFRRNRANQENRGIFTRVTSHHGVDVHPEPCKREACPTTLRIYTREACPTMLCVDHSPGVQPGACAYTYIYIYTHIAVVGPGLIDTHIYMCIQVVGHPSLIYARTYIYLCHIYARARICICMYICICIYVCIHIHL